MDQKFYVDNRMELYQKLEEGSLAIFFCGQEIGKTADESYSFFGNRNFVYLTGIEQRESILLVDKESENQCVESAFVLPKNPMEERWMGRRLTTDEVYEISGIKQVLSCDEFRQVLKKRLDTGRYRSVYLDFCNPIMPVYVSCANRMAEWLRKEYPYLQIRDAGIFLKQMRLIKKPCEIDAMLKAEEIVGEGIIAMMQHSRPGLYEYQYKAEYDYALAQHGVLEAGFPSIISAGKNNFKIHYNEYRGQAMDGDMVLNDVGVRFDHELTDVSRGWPCNGRYTEKQKLLYQCAYRTSEYMFDILKPGIPMEEVDRTIRKVNFEYLKEAGVVERFEDIGTYMWHGGAHHVGFDVHDVVDVAGKNTAPGMVFCVDIGIYHEDWGIGFRIEDNCLITEDGCRNLSAGIPKTIEEIEAIMQ